MSSGPYSVCVCGSFSRAVYQFPKCVQRANSIVRAVPQWACQCKCSLLLPSTLSRLLFSILGVPPAAPLLADICARATILLLLHLTENI